jgi:ADP-ribose pyrophosphatase YjhB (NUDIX family)
MNKQYNLYAYIHLFGQAMTWKPHVTVASLVENEGRFLMVEEAIEGRLVYNQPAGHLEDGEGLLQAVTRETLEETAWNVLPEALCGVYRWRHEASAQTFLRFSFICRAQEEVRERTLDPDIERCLWLSREELARMHGSMRSPLVLRCIDDYLAGNTYPLSLLSDIALV